LQGPRALRSRSVDAGVPRRAAEVRVFPVRRRPAPVHRRVVRVDGTDPDRVHARAAVAPAPRARPSRRPTAARDAARETRDADELRTEKLELRTSPATSHQPPAT